MVRESSAWKLRTPKISSLIAATEKFLSRLNSSYWSWVTRELISRYYLAGIQTVDPIPKQTLSSYLDCLPDPNDSLELKLEFDVPIPADGIIVKKATDGKLFVPLRSPITIEGELTGNRLLHNLECLKLTHERYRFKKMQIYENAAASDDRLLRMNYSSLFGRFRSQRFFLNQNR